MDFEQIQHTLKAMAEMHHQQFESLRLHSELLAGIVPALDSMKASALRHDKQIAEIRLNLLETGEKLDALVQIVDGIIRGGK